MTNPESLFSNQQNVRIIVMKSYLLVYLSLPFQEEEGGLWAAVLLSEGGGEPSWVSGAK